MCTAWSTMGSGGKEEDANSILLLIWMRYHFANGTAILVHENVSSFSTCIVADEACAAGYKHVQIKTNPSDVGVLLGRQRKQLGSSRETCRTAVSK